MTRIPLKLLVLLTLGTLAVVGFGCRPSDVETQEIRIGLPTPLTGGAAPYGKFIRQGAEMAVDDVNSSGKLGSAHLRLIVEDGQGEPEETTKAVRRLISRDKVWVLMSAFLSNATLSEVPIAQNEKIPLVVALSTADKITVPGQPYVFRICSPNARLSKALGDWIVADGSIRKVAYVFENTEFGTNLAENVREVLEPNGIETVAREAITQHETNLLPIVTKLARLKPDAVFLGLISDSAVAFLKQAEEAGLKSRWLNAVSISNPIFLENAGELATGMVGVTHFVSTAPDENSRLFSRRFQDRYGSEPTHYSAVAYDTVRVIADAARRSDFSRGRLNDSLKQTDFDGVTGKISFDKDGQAAIQMIIFQWDGQSMNVLHTVRP